MLRDTECDFSADPIHCDFYPIKQKINKKCMGGSDGRQQTSTDEKCKRSVCVSARQELQLLRGDLDELTTENEQIVEQLAQMQAENQQCKLEVKLRDKEIDSLKTTLDDKTAVLARIKAQSDPKDIIHQQNWHQDLKSTSDDHVPALGKMEPADSTPNTRSILAIRTTKYDGFYDTLKENEQLRIEVSELQSAVQQISKLALAYEEIIESTQCQERIYENTIESQQKAFIQAQNRIQILEEKIADKSQQGTLLEYTLKGDVKTEHRQLEPQYSNLKADNAANQKCKAHISLQKEGHSLCTLENELETLQTLRCQDENVIQNLQSEDLRAVLEHSSLDNARLQKSRKSKDNIIPEETVLDHKNELQKSKNIIQELKTMLQAMENRQIELENDKRVLEEWNRRYELEAGIHDIMLHYRRIEKELDTQKRQNQNLRDKVGDQKDTIVNVGIVCQRNKPQGMTLESSEQELEALYLQEKIVESRKLLVTEDRAEEMEPENADLHSKLLNKKMEQCTQTLNGSTMLLEARVCGTCQTSETEQRDAELNGERFGIEERANCKALNEISIKQMVKIASNVTASILSTALTNVKTLKASADDILVTKEDQDIEEKSVIAAKKASNSAQKSDDIDPSESTKQNATCLTAEIIAGSVKFALEGQMAQWIKTSQMARDSLSHSNSSNGERELKKDLHFALKGEMLSHKRVLEELSVCLDDLSVAQSANTSLQSSLREHERALRAAMDQQSILYKHFVTLQHEKITRQDNFERTNEEAKNKLRDLTLKCEQYEAFIQQVNSDGACTSPTSLEDYVNQARNDDSFFRRMADMTQRMAISELNQARLKRKYHFIVGQLHSRSQVNRDMELDYIEMKKTFKLRILYLESWKEGAEDRMKRMLQTLEQSVLKAPAMELAARHSSLLEKFSLLVEHSNELRLRLLEVASLPAKVSTLEFENTQLRYQQSNCSLDKAAGIEERITQLESLLRNATEQKDSAEHKVATLLAMDTKEHSRNIKRLEKLQQENLILMDRINEVEELYEALHRKCVKYKETATIAAAQAQILIHRQNRIQNGSRDLENRLCEWVATSDEHQVIGLLQRQNMQITSTYQQFAAKYECTLEENERNRAKLQHMELVLEQKAHEFEERRDGMQKEISVLQTAVLETKERDDIAQIARWEVFRKRLDVLEEELRSEQLKRQKLEREIEMDNIKRIRTDPLQSSIDQECTPPNHCLEAKVKTLESRERVLMAQLENIDVSRIDAIQREGRGLKREMAQVKQLNEELIQRLETSQERMTQLQRDLETSERERRRLSNEKENFEKQRKAPATDACEEQHTMEENAIGETHGFQKGLAESSHLQRKVGYYESDQAQLQKAAQTTIASLKSLVEEKNGLIQKYQEKMSKVREEMAQEKIMDCQENQRLNGKLYKDKKDMIEKLREAMEMISQLEQNPKSQRALQAAIERHQNALKQWKRAEMQVSVLRQQLEECEMKKDLIQNEKENAEKQAEEVLEELSVVCNELKVRDQREKDAAMELKNAKRDGADKDAKLKRLRDAITQLKEEFLKAEERHAIAISKAQTGTKNAESELKHQQKAKFMRQNEQLRQRVQHLEAQIREKESTQKKSDSQIQSSRSADRDKAALQKEIARLSNLVKDKSLGESKIVQDLEMQVSVLKAQNLALKQASEGVTRNREEERKVNKRLTMALARLQTKNAEVLQTERRIGELEEELAEWRQKFETVSNAMENKESQIQRMTSHEGDHEQYLERHSQFLTEKLLLERKDWEERYTTQTKQHQEHISRLHQRLTQCSEAYTEKGAGDTMRDKIHEASQGKGIWTRQEAEYIILVEFEDELKELRHNVYEKEQETMHKDTKLLEYELEIESLHVEVSRLKQRNTATQPQNRVNSSEISGSLTTSHKHIPLRTQERLEFENIIENMRRLIAKLRAENEKLEKEAQKGRQVGKLQRKSRILESKIEQLTQEKQSTQIRLEGLMNENEELVRKANHFESQRRREVKENKLQQSNAALKEEIEQLRQQLRDKSADLHDAHNQDAQLRQRLEDEIVELQDENERLRKELDAFDEEFFEEIEDLKFKYAQTMREKQNLEQQINRKQDNKYL